MLLEESGCLTYLCFTPMTPVSWSSEYPRMGFTHPRFILKKVTDLKGLHMCKKLYCRVCRLPVEDSCYYNFMYIYMNYTITCTYMNIHIITYTAAAAKSLQSCPTLWDPMVCSLSGSSVHGILQARIQFSSVQFSSVAQSFPTLYDPMNRSTPGLPVHYQLLEFTQTHVHRVSDALQAYWQVITGMLLCHVLLQGIFLTQGLNPGLWCLLHLWAGSREGNSNPLQCSCLENPMGRGAWQATVHGGHKALDMTERLSLSLLYHESRLSLLHTQAYTLSIYMSLLHTYAYTLFTHMFHYYINIYTWL